VPVSNGLEKIAAIVGPQHVSTAKAELDRLARTTLPQKGTRPSGVVYPGHRDEVQQIVRIASEQNIPIYPISTGKNWGYGDACAPIDGCLIIDLSRMNRILEVNTELAYAVVEPGVTQGQLSRYLNDQKLPLIMDATGAGPDASLVGNILERGFGHTPYGDRFAHSCNYEVVLADGQIIFTGFGHYEKSESQHLYKWGVGASLDGLLTQSNFGVVTRMTVWLMPQPESVEYLFFSLKDEKAIGPLADSLRRLRLQGTLRSTLHIFNQARILAGKQPFPWNQADGKQALETQHPELFQNLCRKHGVPAWAGTGVLMGSCAGTAAARRQITKEFRRVPGMGLVIFLNDRRLRWLRRLAHLVQRWVPVLRNLAEIQIGVDLLAGRPSLDGLKSSHWRSRRSHPMKEDPLNTDAGLLWISPILPMTSQAVNEVSSLARGTFHESGFEFQIAYSCVEDRVLCAIITLCFDKSNIEEESRAKACCEKLTDRLLEKGYVPYRGSPLVMEHVRRKSPQYWSALSRLKRAWDPQGILSPGRYIP
jgi:4-cresol dehydrogenase (hydroxylating) flavoprotein subunit